MVFDSIFYLDLLDPNEMLDLVAGFPLFSSHEIPWLFQYFCHFSPTFYPQGSKMQIIFIYDFKWGYNFKLTLHGDNWNVLKCYEYP